MLRLGIAAALVIALLAPASAQAAPQYNGPFMIPTGTAKPTGITSGPDGALWFAEHDNSLVGRIAVDGTITEPGVLAVNSQPNGIVSGPDGKLWLTTRGGNGGLVNVASTGALGGPFTFVTAPVSTDPIEIITGPDGALWFTDVSNHMVGQITTGGAITRFPTSGGTKPHGIATGPDGNLWYTLQGDKGRIGRMTPAGVATAFQTPTQDSNPTGIVAGPDGALWFTEQAKDKIGRITTAGLITEFPVAGGHPTDIALGADGNLWFVQPRAIGRITAAGVVDSWATPATAAPVEIVAGPDGNLWFTDDGRNAIGQITAGPGVDAVAVTDASQSTATLRASVHPAGQATTYYFEYGATAAYGSSTAAVNAGAGTSAVTASAPLTGLAPQTQYHYRLVATNGTDTTRGPDRMFTTSALASDPITEPIVSSAPNQVSDTPNTPPPPVLGRTVVVGPEAGVVKVRLAGTGSFVPLTGSVSVPTGSELDTTKGSVTLVSALDTRGHAQTGTFSGGRFKVKQSKGGKGMTDLYLSGPKPGRCSAPNRASASKVAKKRKRSLWGKDNKGRFRTHGADSVATVRGTRWLTEDRCDGTLTRVTEGSVVVRDLHRKRNKVVRAGQSYLARRK